MSVIGCSNWARKETRYQKRGGHIKTRWADCLSALIGRTFEQHFPFFLGLVAQLARAADS